MRLEFFCKIGKRKFYGFCILFIPNYVHCSECEIQQILTKLVRLQQHYQKTLKQIVLKLVGLQ